MRSSHRVDTNYIHHDPLGVQDQSYRTFTSSPVSRGARKCSRLALRSLRLLFFLFFFPDVIWSDLFASLSLHGLQRPSFLYPFLSCYRKLIVPVSLLLAPSLSSWTAIWLLKWTKQRPRKKVDAPLSLLAVL
jgi:hypothetical protein